MYVCGKETIIESLIKNTFKKIFLIFQLNPEYKFTVYHFMI